MRSPLAPIKHPHFGFFCPICGSQVTRTNHGTVFSFACTRCNYDNLSNDDAIVELDTDEAFNAIQAARNSRIGRQLKELT